MRCLLLLSGNQIHGKNIRYYEYVCMHAKSLQSCPTLGDPTVCSLPGSSVHRLLQARILEGAAMPSSRESFPTQKSNPRFLHFLIWQVGSLPLAPPGKTYYEYTSTLSPGYNTCNSCWIEKQNLEEWDGDGGGKEAQEGGDMCIHTADSHSCTAETSTIL